MIVNFLSYLETSLKSVNRHGGLVLTHNEIAGETFSFVSNLNSDLFELDPLQLPMSMEKALFFRHGLLWTLTMSKHQESFGHQ